MVHREPRWPPGAGEQRARAHADHRARQARQGRDPVRLRRRQRSRGRTAPLLTALRRLAERGVALGALCTGGYALARAGLLDNYRATIHWENLSALREEFPRVQLSDQVFSIDRERYTCSGGTAPLDLMLNLIQLKLGPRVSQLVSEQFVLERVRSDQDRQYMPLRAQVGVSHRKPDQGRRAHGREHREAAVAR